jgi:hypothetical protein
VSMNASDSATTTGSVSKSSPRTSLVPQPTVTYERSSTAQMALILSPEDSLASRPLTLPPRCAASSSRSQVAVRTARAAVRLIWERPSVNVRQRLVMNVPIVTQLVTRLASESVRGLVLVRGQAIPCLQS